MSVLCLGIYLGTSCLGIGHVALPPQPPVYVTGCAHIVARSKDWQAGLSAELKKIKVEGGYVQLPEEVQEWLNLRDQARACTSSSTVISTVVAPVVPVPPAPVMALPIK